MYGSWGKAMPCQEATECRCVVWIREQNHLPCIYTKQVMSYFKFMPNPINFSQLMCYTYRNTVT